MVTTGNMLYVSLASKEVVLISRTYPAIDGVPCRGVTSMGSVSMMK